MIIGSDKLNEVKCKCNVTEADFKKICERMTHAILNRGSWRVFDEERTSEIIEARCIKFMEKFMDSDKDSSEDIMQKLNDFINTQVLHLIIPSSNRIYWIISVVILIFALLLNNHFVSDPTKRNILMQSFYGKQVYVKNLCKDTPVIGCIVEDRTESYRLEHQYSGNTWLAEKVQWFGTKKVVVKFAGKKGHAVSSYHDYLRYFQSCFIKGKMIRQDCTVTVYQATGLGLYEDGDVESLCRKYNKKESALKRPTKNEARQMTKDFMQHIGEVSRDLYAKGLIHRDIKPGNILMRKRGESGWTYDFFLTDYDVVSISKATGAISGHNNIYARHYSEEGSNHSLMDVHMILPPNAYDGYDGYVTKAQYAMKFAANLESDMIFDITMAAIRLFGSLTQSKVMKHIDRDKYLFFLTADYVNNPADIIGREEGFIEGMDMLSRAMETGQQQNGDTKSMEELIVCILQKEVDQVKNAGNVDDDKFGFDEFLKLLEAVKIEDENKDVRVKPNIYRFKR